MAINPAKVKVASTYKHEGTFYSLCGAGNRLWAGSDDFAIHLFDLAAAKKEEVGRWTGHDNFVSALVHTGKHVVSGSYDRRLIWWDAQNGKQVRSFEAHAGWIRDLALTPDKSRLVSAGDDMRVKVWDAASGKKIHDLAGHALKTPQGHVTALYTVAISPDGKLIASGDRHGDVRVWDLSSGKQVQNFQVPVLYTYDPVQRKRSIGGIRTVAFSLDSKLLAAGGIGQVGNVDGFGGKSRAEIWDWHKPAYRVTADGGGNGVINQLLFHHAGELLIGGGTDFLALWKTDALRAAKPGKGKENNVPVARRIKSDSNIHRFCLNAKGTQLYAAGYRRLDVWSLDA